MVTLLYNKQNKKYGQKITSLLTTARNRHASLLISNILDY